MAEEDLVKLEVVIASISLNVLNSTEITKERMLS